VALGAPHTGGVPSARRALTSPRAPRRRQRVPALYPRLAGAARRVVGARRRGDGTESREEAPLARAPLRGGGRGAWGASAAQHGGGAGLYSV
jgi:hypothetical protein